MSRLWQAGYIVAIFLGVAYLIIPRRVDKFGFEFLRGSSSDQSVTSDATVWIYRGLGVLFLFFGLTGVV